jgi:hypothetical protein
MATSGRTAGKVHRRRHRRSAVLGEVALAERHCQKVGICTSTRAGPAAPSLPLMPVRWVKVRQQQKATTHRFRTV